MFHKVRQAIRSWWLLTDLAECQQRLNTLLEHRAAKKAGWYVGYDSFPGELDRDIRRYEEYVVELREKLGYPPYVPPQYSFERNPYASL